MNNILKVELLNSINKEIERYKSSISLDILRGISPKLSESEIKRIYILEEYRLCSLEWKRLLTEVDIKCNDVPNCVKTFEYQNKQDYLTTILKENKDLSTFQVRELEEMKINDEICIGNISFKRIR